MSHAGSPQKSVSIPSLQKRKDDREKISMVTCYDAAFGRLVEVSPIDIVLVGDSLGNVVLGYKSTIPVTLEDMIHHAAAVTRSVFRPLVVGDMPFMTYATIEDALHHAAALMQRGGVAAVKLEGGKAICPQVKALVASGFPVMGHLGLTPQSVHALGGYRVQGATDSSAKQILDDAKALEDAGVFSLVLEMVPQALGKKVSESLRIPTIGIGAGPHCDGQVLVLHDLLGFDESFAPKFLKKYLNLSASIKSALAEFDGDVKAGSFPKAENSFGN